MPPAEPQSRKHVRAQLQTRVNLLESRTALTSITRTSAPAARAGSAEPTRYQRLVRKRITMGAVGARHLVAVARRRGDSTQRRRAAAERGVDLHSCRHTVAQLLLARYCHLLRIHLAICAPHPHLGSLARTR
jgi:hypothetical protein